MASIDRKCDTHRQQLDSGEGHDEPSPRHISNVAITSEKPASDA
ncbi:hypothetical protein C7S15_3806 [Burkholderia cepacia]|nr:hypothetical protein [Burkholderia cepacia]